MEKTYTPHAIEQSWYQKWEERGYFAPQGSGSAAGGRKPGAAAPQGGDEADAQGSANAPGGREPKGAYCIMIPPPNVTGTLHMGHAFQDTIMDALIRFNRMKGKDTLWQPGTDHAGIATQMVVERQLNAKGKTRHDLGREKFIEKVWEWKEQSGGAITQQLRRMGASPDWSRERFTMDKGLSDAVNEVFVRLHEEGIIYRGKRLVNWDPVLHTALSDLEVISEEESGHLWHLRYPLTDGSDHLVVATTRPETMLGDSAVAVHPDDERYKHLIGQTITLPLVGREIPIIADDYVDPEFGTGCVKITPAHDFNDYAMGQRHKLPLYNIFTINASINDEAPAPYRGLDRYAAREVIVHDLDKLELIEKIEHHTLKVPRGDRSHAVVEPYLTDQWYVKAAPLAGPAIKAVEDGDIKFVPDNWKNTYFEWMRNIEDWCISRQIWWGHRIPAWYDNGGNVFVGRTEAEARRKHKIPSYVKLKQDEDVLDTWFSSALWPFSTLGWPNQTAELEKFYPTSVLVTGFDIIFFWVARMIMMGLKFMDDVPFKEVYIHGLVRDSHGQKMSKSKGNVLDPIDLIDGIELEALVTKRTSGLMQPEMAKKIEKQTREDFDGGISAYGTDALRFTFASLASTGRDINFDLGRVEGYRNFCNKIWNASRFVLMNVAPGEQRDAQSAPAGTASGETLINVAPGEQRDAQSAPAGTASGETLINVEGADCGQNGETFELSTADRWIISKLQKTEADVNRAIDLYRLDLAAQAIYEFSWNNYCDWYLELTKPLLNSDESSAEAKRGTRRTLVRVLESILRLAHPIMPYITEEIWQQVAQLAGKEGDTIMLQPFPEADESQIDSAAEAQMEWVMEFIVGIRKIRSGMNIKPGQLLPVLLQNGSESDHTWLAANETNLLKLARLESITWLHAGDEAPESATSLVGEMKVLVPMAGLIDKDAELQRLDKQIDQLNKETKRLSGKLCNEKFVGKAPAEVVAKEREKLTDAEGSLAQLKEQRERIAAM